MWESVGEGLRRRWVVEMIKGLTENVTLRLTLDRE